MIDLRIHSWMLAHTGKDDVLYDEAYGPHRMTRYKCCRTEWDDPTWYPVTVDVEYMTNANDAAAAISSTQRVSKPRAAHRHRTTREKT